jgi:tyrosine-protein kinase Etk/Wzc
MSNKSEQLLDVLKVIILHRKWIRNITFIAFLGSLVVSFLLPNYYRSSTTFYPASPDLASPEQLFGTTSIITDYFGNEHDLDRLLEISDSEELAKFMIDSFGLYAHYAIDSTERESAFKVRKEFRKLYTVEKNKFDAIEIAIEDKDINLCAPMVNAAREKVNQLAQKLTRESQKKLMQALETNITNKQAALLGLNDSLEHVKNTYGIYDVNSQGEQLAELATASRAQVIQQGAILKSLEADQNVPRDTIAYIRARLRGYERHLESLKSKDAMSAASYNTGAQVVQVLQDLHFQARKQLSYDIERFNQIKSTYQTEIPALHVIEEGDVPLRKSRPVRSVLILVSTLATLIFTCLGLLLHASFKEINWKRLTDDK